MKRLLPCLLVALVLLGNARAVEVPIALPAGTHSSFNLTFSDLNGTAVNGQALLIDFLYNANVRFYPSAMGFSYFSASIYLQFQPTATPIAPSSGSGFVLTTAGARMANGLGPITVIDSTGPSTGAYMFWDGSLGAFPFDHDGLRFALQLPDMGGAQVVAGRLAITMAGGNLAVGAVPEGGNGLLLLGGAVALLLAAYKAKPALARR